MSDIDDPARTAHLTVSQCWSLLRTHEVGRLAVVVEDRPDIFPLNYAVDHGTVVVRTGEGSKLTASRSNPHVAFEVDEQSASDGHAWSVVLKGSLHTLQGTEDLIDAMGLPLFPWHEVPGQRYLRLVPDEVSGRRFVAAPHEPPADPGGT